VRAILAYCARTGRHATFRAGGTSLNGQSRSDDILIDVRRHWGGLVVEDGGARLRARPGTAEFMLAPALAAAAQAFPGTPQYWRSLDPAAAASALGGPAAGRRQRDVERDWP